MTNMTYATSSPAATTGGQGNSPVSRVRVLRMCSYRICVGAYQDATPFLYFFLSLFLFFFSPGETWTVLPNLLSAADGVLAPHHCVSSSYRASPSNLSRSYQPSLFSLYSTISPIPHPPHSLPPSFLDPLIFFYNGDDLS